MKKISFLVSQAVLLPTIRLLFARLLIKNGYDVRVIMTASAQAFITPLTLQAFDGQPSAYRLVG